MKKIFSILLVFTLIITGATGMSVTAAEEDCSTSNTSELYEAKIVQAAGEKFIAEAAESTSPEWEGVELLNSTAYHDLQGSVIGYMFTISKKGKTLGYIMVGNSQYNYDVLEAAETIPPSSPNEEEIKSIISSDLQSEYLNEPMLVYLGYNRYYAIYEIGEQKIGVNLRSKDYMEYDKLETSLATSEQYKAYYINRPNNTKDVDWVELDVIQRNMGDVPDCDNNCGPTTAAMISDWWKQFYDFDYLPTWYNDHDELYEEMYCNNWGPFGLLPGTSPTHFGPGFLEYASNHGYDNLQTDWCLNRDYSIIQAEINASRPMGVVFSYNLDYTNWHWCCVKGFDTRGEVDYIIINDPQGFESSANWASVKLTSGITRIQFD